jgi:signal transduction histidine kinase
MVSRRLLEGRGIALRVGRRSEPNAPSVRADPDLSCQVLLGLVSNAADASRRESAIEVDWREAAGRIVFRVRDGGPGVPRELRDRIFDPFFTTKAEGTGLGLAVARELAEAQGGVLLLEPEEGLGASFALYLPKAS